MFKIESYVTPILLSYVDKYVKDFKPNDAQVSLWGGGVALHNLVLKADVLQQEVALPFTLVSGRIHELLIQVPWTKVMSEPIIVTIDTIECVLSLTPPTPTDEAPAESSGRRTQVVEAPPGYMQALVRRIVSNIALRVHHLIVKYVQDDIVLSLNVKHLAVDSAGADWLPAFADIDQNEPVIRRLVRLDDLTLCLDKADSDGKIRFYQEPLLYRCQLDLRVLTRLVSATTRRAASLSVQLRSSRLAWGVTSDQMVLLLRLMRERPLVEPKPPPPTTKMASTQALHATSSNSAEPARQESWSDWAWSWLPTWMDREGAVEEAPMPAVPIPVHFTAYLDDVSLVFKVMELEGGSRKRARGVLELSARHAAAKVSLRAPTLLRVRLGLRTLELASRGKCVCGHLGLEASKDEPTIYLRKADLAEDGDTWTWPEEDLSNVKVELAEAADEELGETFKVKPLTEDSRFKSVLDQGEAERERASTDTPAPPAPPGEPGEDELWLRMEPVVYVDYAHERSPPHAYTNPYENPPDDFEYSDWGELCEVNVKLRPLEARVCMGLVHRVTALRGLLQELPPTPLADQPMRVLTVEECEALLENLPQRRVSVAAAGLRVRLVPWDHAPGERPADPPLVLDLVAPSSNIVLTAPLYPYRVCSAACQMPNDSGPLWNGARLRVSGAFSSLEAQLSARGDAQTRPCARADLRVIVNLLLNKHLFTRRESVVVSYSVKIREVNICGSAARLQAAYYVPASLLNQRVPLILKYTSLARDAMTDEESVAIDVTLEEFSLRGYLTNHINTHILSLQAARATAYHSTKGADLKQAWIFSAPDTPTTTPYLRSAIQWCWSPLPNSLDYVGMWTEPVSYSADPLLIAWLAYQPTVRNSAEFGLATQSQVLRPVPSTQYFLRRRTTPPSSGGRGTRSGSGAEQVHHRPRSLGSSSEPSERREQRPTKDSLTSGSMWESGEWLPALHARLRRMLVHVELGLVLVYVSSASASALDCATVRDAMERHAADHRPVLALSLGRISMHSNSAKKHLWQEIRHDGPTFIAPTENSPDDTSFPWKMRVADMSCYTLELPHTGERSSRERSLRGLRSQLKVSTAASPKTVLEALTTTITLSVVTKNMQTKQTAHKEHKKHTETSTEEEKVKYFQTGTDFKPSTLKEFFRGPAKRNATPEPEEKPKEKPEQLESASGPMVSLGVHLHADTPPIVLRLDHEQVHLVALALHGLQHVVTLVQREPVMTRNPATAGQSQRNLIRSVSELEEVRSNSDTPSENRSELISIFESNHFQPEIKVKTFFWSQWVVSRATLVVATRSVKLAFDVDDIISTVDLQQHYNQFKVKVASASVRHYERTGSEEWTAGVLGGRVLEVREPANAQEENHFMSVTITQAQISNLPANWKEELHPKLLEQKNGVDTMWEIYATLAPLEVVVQPTILENIVSLLHEFSPRSFCPLRAELANRQSTWQWPFCYVNAGGLRLLMTCEDVDNEADDTFMIVIGKVTVNPHPENPICRRTVNLGADTSWMSGGGLFEGRQYEVLIKNFAIRSAQFGQLVFQEDSEKEMMQSTGGENPALKWAQPIIAPVITPMLHAVDIGCVLAPAMFLAGALACGPAVELNLVSDCALDVSVEQVALAQRVLRDLLQSLVHRSPPGIEEHDACPYASLLMNIAPTDELSVFSDTLSYDAETLKPTLVSTEPGPNTVGIGGKNVGESGGENLGEGGGGSLSGGGSLGGGGSTGEGGGSTGGGEVAGRAGGTDSGVETVTSHSTIKSGTRLRGDYAPKKSVSIAFNDHMADASEFLEVFVTMGTIEVSLYVGDDGSPEASALRPPPAAAQAAAKNEPPVQVNVVFEKSEEKKEEVSSSSSKDKSLTDDGGLKKVGARSALNMQKAFNARRTEGAIALAHLTLHQPNLYYWRRRSQKSLQLSLFNAWVGLGAGQTEGRWNLPLLTTARGVPDPVTDIPPALLTVKATAPIGSSSNKGVIKIDVERPVLLEVCTDRLRRLKGISALIMDRISRTEDNDTPVVQLPAFYRWRRFFINQAIESVTLQTGQLALSGAEGCVGVDALAAQLAAGARPERLAARALLTALLLAAGPPHDTRHVVLQPLTLGADLEALWETWRRAEGGMSACEPTVRVSVDLDCVALDLRPSELAALARVRDALAAVAGDKPDARSPTHSAASEPMFGRARTRPLHAASLSFPQAAAPSDHEPADHYYKDDLRSGAFKIVSGGQLPMAYQVTLHGPGVAWRYPHPRAITRIVTFPLPGQEEEVECILEFYSPMLMRWHPHTYFKIPVIEPRELQLNVSTTDTVFSYMWRYRARAENEQLDVPYEFSIDRFLPRTDPLLFEYQPEMEYPRGSTPVSAEQLSGIVRVDSYFAPRALPRVRVAARVVAFDLHLHNSLPFLSSSALTALEGYYVSKPLLRAHRVLALGARDAALHAHLGSSHGYKLLLYTRVSSDVFDCATGAMEQMVEEFPLQAGLSVPLGELARARLRVWAGAVHAALHVPRLRTLRALHADWRTALDQYLSLQSESTTSMPVQDNFRDKRELAEATAAQLDGRVSLWIHNSCGAALRVGQEGTDEVVPLGPGARLSYKWRNPTAPKQIRIALALPTADWHWSSSCGFTVGSSRVRLEGAEALGGSAGPGGGVYAHLRVERVGARRTMHIAGRLALANMLRHGLLYKVTVRARCPEASQWRTVCTGELQPESVGRSVMCGAECDMTLKIKFVAHDTGWSGDIPLKECPKENVPWLVKVPSAGEIPYVSVWCRVVRARSDGRVLATLWPLYVLHSHLPLDTDVLIVTETTATFLEEQDETNSAPLVQTAAGRGACTHLVAPGTTSARHSLSFQYRNIECPVTREAVPLHYGVTDTSVFDKRTPVNSVEDVIQDVFTWLERSGRNATSTWPYSMVTKHYPGTWQPALMQPRCDVTVRYQSVSAGGGCCLELQLCPLALLCNAGALALTLRAHDAAPLCKLEPGAAIAPPAAVLKKPFFMSVEIGRETFVSSQLEISDEPVGRYAAPPPNRVALDRATPFIIHCNQKVALLTMYYEIKHEINVLGVSTTFVLLNRLNTNILISAVAVPTDSGADVDLQPKSFKVVEPIKEGSTHGLPLSRFWVRGRWRGTCGDPAELAPFLCVALPSGACPAAPPVPVRLGRPPLRRAVALADAADRPMAVVVTQLKHEGRWLVSVARDPCPQFLVRNRTRLPLALAQPRAPADPAAPAQAEAECEGARYQCVVRAGGATHYSSPAHCARYPPPAAAHAPPPHALQFLTLARAKEEGVPQWCSPVAVAEGEQLVQLGGGVTVKLRVRTHPHSTLLELQDVDQNDISASDIRKRLYEPHISTETLLLTKKEKTSSRKLIRIGGDEKLLDRPLPEEAEVAVEEETEPTSSAHAQEAGAASQLDQGEAGTMVLNTVVSDTQLSINTPMPEHRTDGTAEDEGLPRASRTHLDESLTEMSSLMFPPMHRAEWEEGGAAWAAADRARCVVAALSVELSASADARPLVALHISRAALLVVDEPMRTKTTLAIAGLQVDNLQYENGNFDFGVVASTPNMSFEEDRPPPLWSMLVEAELFDLRQDDAKFLLRVQHDSWGDGYCAFTELTEVELSLGPLALYVEDAYVTALVELARLAAGAAAEAPALAALRALEAPLRLEALLVRPLDLTLTLHTAVRMYIALDQSPLHLGAFRLTRAMTSVERLTHALTVHYLSAAILGAGWVVGGLELLGAPGALAARVGGASGGVRGVASAAAAALVRSLSAWAGSLARNLDLLAGDEEHSRRAAAARRRPPPSLVAGLMAGITNFAINILGAVGGLAHHPLVGVAVGEASGAAALRRGLVGALAKPLSATADLVAYAGHGLLTQTGWDPVPQARPSRWGGDGEGGGRGGWRRDAVRWSFRLAEMTALAGFEVLLDDAPLQLLLTHKFLVVADPDTERLVEMIDFKFCSVGPYRGPIIELSVSQRRAPKAEARGADEDDEYQLSSAAMARVARYAGQAARAEGGARVLRLLPAPGRAHALHAALSAAARHNSDAHHALL